MSKVKNGLNFFEAFLFTAAISTLAGIAPGTPVNAARHVKYCCGYDDSYYDVLHAFWLLAASLWLLAFGRGQQQKIFYFESSFILVIKLLIFFWSGFNEFSSVVNVSVSMKPSRSAMIICVSSSKEEPSEISMNLLNSISLFRLVPSAILEGIDTAALHICDFNPNFLPEEAVL